jgi:hypothetical protein
MNHESRTLKGPYLQLITLSLFVFLGSPDLTLADNALPGHENQTQASDPVHESYLHGKAVLAHGAALSGATIFILNSRGTDITDVVLAPAGRDFCKPLGRRCTSDSGSFAFKVIGKIPSKFRIVAKGGRINGKRNNFILEQWIDNHASLKYGADLTIGSTVFSKLVGKGLSKDIALARTRKALNIPDWGNLGTHLHHSAVYLSGFNLFEAATRHGGHRYSMQQLIASARWGRTNPWIDESKPSKIKAAPPAPPAPTLELDGLPEWGTTILKGIPGQIVGSLLGAGVNWVVGAIGLNPTTNSLERIEGDLSNISTQLSSIKSAINDLFAEVNSNFANLKLLEQCNNDRQAANVYWSTVQSISDEIVSYTAWLQQLADYGNGKESLATAITAWNHLNSTGDDLSSGKGINSLINALTGLNSPPSQKGFISNVVAAFGSCTQQQGKMFLNAGERAAYASTFDWGMALMLTASMIQNNYNYAGTWKCVVAPQGTPGGSTSLFCPTGMLAFPSDVAAGTTAPSPTPANIYYAFNNAYPQMMPSGVSADLRSGLLWTRAPVRPDVMIDATGLVKNIRAFPVKTTSRELPINSITQWKIPSLNIAQALINGTPAGTLPADWLSKNTQAIVGEETFDSVADNLSSQRLYADSVLGSPASNAINPSNDKDLAAPWGSLIPLFSQGDNAQQYYLAGPPYIPNNTRAYGIITMSNVNTTTCLASQAMFGSINNTNDQGMALCAPPPVPGYGFSSNPNSLTPASTKSSYQLVMLDQSADVFSPDWPNGFPSSFSSLLNCRLDCKYGGYHTFVFRDSSTPVYNDTNDILVHGFGIPKDYEGHYITALSHDQTKEKVFSREITNRDGSVATLLHAPSFTLIPADWAINTTP